MIRRLVERDYERHRASPTEEKLRFWIRESRTPAHLFEIARAAPVLVDQELESRPSLRLLKTGDPESVENALFEEQARERALDREYWKPLRAELEAMRHSRGSSF